MTSAKDKIARFEERRRYPRIIVDAQVTLGISGNRSVEALIHDISPGGVQLHCERTVAAVLKAEMSVKEADINMDFMLNINGKDVDVYVRCRLAWIVKMDDGSYALGVQFTQVENQYRQLLKKFIETSMEPE